jgi:predicted permease
MSGHNEKTGGPATPVVSPVAQQSPEAKSTSERPSLWTRIQESWITEFVALIVSAGAIAAIVGLLSKYNERELPSWNGVSLNSLVSWLTTAAGICIGYVAGTSIAQLRWVWMAQEPRKMEDLRLFSGADGVVGALELLLRLRFR